MSILQTKEIFVKKLLLLVPEDRLDFGKAKSYFKVEKINYKKTDQRTNGPINAHLISGMCDLS